MSRKLAGWWVAGLIASVITLAIAAPVRAGSIPDPAAELFSADTSGDYICPRELLRRHMKACPPFGPGTAEIKHAYLLRLINSPDAQLHLQEVDYGRLTPFQFAYVRNLPANVYSSPEAAAAGEAPVKVFITGMNWVSIRSTVEYSGTLWYEINPHQYVEEKHIAIGGGSRFHGVALAEQPRFPFGWIIRNVNPSTTPGGWQDYWTLFKRYDLVQLFAEEIVDGEVWYMVGPDQWIPQNTVARVDVDPPPSGVPKDAKWIEVNTFEQTLAAYEGERLVYATLTSSGSRRHFTPSGLYRIWSKLRSTPMSSKDVGPDNPLWFYLEDVEWTQYFYGAYALHAAYWHDDFGFIRSHGCVNLALYDAKWLYFWTEPQIGEYENFVAQEGVGTYVWVHYTPPIPTGKPDPYLTSTYNRGYVGGP